MDTARAKDVRVGGEETPMPSLSGLADKGTSFTSTMANAPWTLPSHGTLFSGQLPSEHGAHALHKSFEYGPTLASCLTEAGYHTTAVSNNTWISGEFGFARGFEEFLSTWQLFQDETDFGAVARTQTGLVDRLRGVLENFRGNPLKNAANLTYGQFFRKRHDDGARRANRLIENRLDDWRDRPEPLFLFINYLEPHLEYRPPEEFARVWLPEGITLSEANEINQDAWAYITGQQQMSKRDFEVLQCLYRAELAYLDQRIADLHSAFADAGLAEDTVFIVTSDHGENIGDHGLMDHQYSLYETLLNVPLVISGPGFEGGKTITTPVQLADLFPTVLEVANASYSDSSLAGRSLTTAKDLPDKRALFAEYIGPQPEIETLCEKYTCEDDINEYDRRLRAVRVGSEKYIRGSDGSEWLFDLEEDPAEQTNLSDHRSARRHALTEQLEAHVESLPSITTGSGDIEANTKARLEDLGYLQ